MRAHDAGAEVREHDGALHRSQRAQESRQHKWALARERNLVERRRVRGEEQAVVGRLRPRHLLAPHGECRIGETRAGGEEQQLSVPLLQRGVVRSAILDPFRHLQREPRRRLDAVGELERRNSASRRRLAQTTAGERIDRRFDGPCVRREEAAAIRIGARYRKRTGVEKLDDGRVERLVVHIVHEAAFEAVDQALDVYAVVVAQAATESAGGAVEPHACRVNDARDFAARIRPLSDDERIEYAQLGQPVEVGIGDIAERDDGRALRAGGMHSAHEQHGAHSERAEMLDDREFHALKLRTRAPATKRGRRHFARCHDPNRSALAESSNAPSRLACSGAPYRAMAASSPLNAITPVSRSSAR